MQCEHEKCFSAALSFDDARHMFRRSTEDTSPSLFLSVLSAPNTTQGFLTHVPSTARHQPIGPINTGWSGRTLTRRMSRKIFGLVEVKELCSSARGLFKSVKQDRSVDDSMIASLLRSGLTVIGVLVQSM